MPDLRKTKKQFVMEAILAGGVGVDMCRTCKLKKAKDSFLCEGCPEAWRKIPGWPVEEYYSIPVHGVGSA